MWPFKKLTRLPITELEFDILTNKLMAAYKLKDIQHTRAILSLTIQHMPANQAYCTMDHLGHSILRNLAYQLARHQSNLIQHDIQVKDLEATIRLEPNNQQAIDSLEKAAKEGSESAKGALKRLYPNPQENVLPLH